MDGNELTDLPAQSSLEELLGSEKEPQPTSRSYPSGPRNCVVPASL
jgi:hypothetical protein